MLQYLNKINQTNIKNKTIIIITNIINITFSFLHKKSVIRESFTTFYHAKNIIKNNKKHTETTFTILYHSDIKDMMALYFIYIISLGISIYILPPFYQPAFYQATAIVYLIFIPPSIGLFLNPNHEQNNNNIMMRTIRQYIIHTPIAALFLYSINITHNTHPIITTILFLELIQFTLFICCNQFAYNISTVTHEQYQKTINRISRHAYIKHLRSQNISMKINPNHTLIQKIILPPYSDTIKKMHYNRINTH